MTRKRIASLFSCLLLLTAILPLTAAHLTNPAGSTTSALASNGDLYRWSGATPSTSDGVSGTYINGYNAFLTGGAAFPLAIGGVYTVFPDGYHAIGSTMCDLEVLGDGTTHDPLDEKRVDADPHAGPGSVPDGTWDDGGVGGACHTEDQYAHGEYNSPGCGVGGSHAVAEDRVSGGEVWIGVSCDKITRPHGDPYYLGCVLAALPPNPDVGESVECLAGHVLGFPPIDWWSCGSDSIADATNYGPGGGSGSAFGVPYPDHPECDGGSATVSTFSYVTVGGNPGHPSTLPGLVPATAGWIDSRDLSDVNPLIRSDQGVAQNGLGPGQSV